MPKRSSKKRSDANQTATLVAAAAAENLQAPSTLEVKDPAVVKIGSILAIRRNGGIIGRVKVGEVSPEGAVGNPSGILEDRKPQVGDELIVAPAD